MELFRAEKFGDLESNEGSHRGCRSWDNKLRLIRAVDRAVTLTVLLATCRANRDAERLDPDQRCRSTTAKKMAHGI